MNISANFTAVTLAVCLLPISVSSLAQSVDGTDTPSVIEGADDLQNQLGNTQANQNSSIVETDSGEVTSTINSNMSSSETASAEFESTVSQIEWVDAECQRIGNKLGSVSYEECMDLNLDLTGSLSNKNAPILFKEYPPLPSRNPLGRVLLMGGVHGDEYSSVSVTFKWLGTLKRFHSGLFHWRIAPLVNPDGLLIDKSTRTNANGVDINRNFPIDDWQDTAINYWKNRAGSSERKYPGPNALSEPETNWVVNEINNFAPDVIISVHAPHGVVDYDGPEDGPYKLGRLYLNLLGTYPGSLGNYAGIQRQIPVVTIELPYAGIMPTPKEVADIWRDLVRWLVNNVPQLTKKTETQDTDPS